MCAYAWGARCRRQSDCLLSIQQATYVVGVNSGLWHTEPEGTDNPRTAVYPKHLIVAAERTHFGDLRYESFIGPRACVLRVDFRMLFECPECAFVGSRCTARKHHTNHGQRSASQRWWLQPNPVMPADSDAGEASD
jgi:hypothetical protein